MNWGNKLTLSERIAREEADAMWRLAKERLERAEAAERRADALERALVDISASLNAAISLLERGGRKAASSDTMFRQMLSDYRASLDRARAALTDQPAQDGEPSCCARTRDALKAAESALCIAGDHLLHCDGPDSDDHQQVNVALETVRAAIRRTDKDAGGGDE
jgi:hypothetical protein